MFICLIELKIKVKFSLYLKWVEFWPVPGWFKYHMENQVLISSILYPVDIKLLPSHSVSLLLGENSSFIHQFLQQIFIGYLLCRKPCERQKWRMGRAEAPKHRHQEPRPQGRQWRHPGQGAQALSQAGQWLCPRGLTVKVQRERELGTF